MALETLMKFVPRQSRAGWRKKAMDVAEKADLWARLDLFVEARGEFDPTHVDFDGINRRIARPPEKPTSTVRTS